MFPFKLIIISVLLDIAVVQRIISSQQMKWYIAIFSNTFDVESLIVFYNPLQFKQFWQLLGVVFRCLETGVVLQTIFSTNNIFILNKELLQKMIYFLVWIIKNILIMRCSIETRPPHLLAVLYLQIESPHPKDILNHICSHKRI